MKYLKSYKIFEAIESSDDEYFSAIKNHYDDELLNMIKSGEKMVKNITGNKILTYKSDSDNLIIRYSVGNEYLCILGAVSKSGKLNKGDILDLNNWINQAVQYMEDGYTLTTSPNELSEPLIKKIIKKCSDKGIELDIHEQPLNIKDKIHNRTWKNMIIRKL